MKNVGLWIDVQKAIIVSATEQVFDIDFVNSDIDSCRWQMDVWELPTAIRKRLSDDQLGFFYETVSGRVLDARSILIFGPGDAKSHLRRRLSTDHFAGTIIGFESSETISESQIFTRVKTSFKHAQKEFKIA
ncbi:MAG: hypothetical protein PSX80_12645 [bacterium]|nr:hypothetical protein [bacterium]